MKVQTKVKGFTLIELIVVLAIFMGVMVAAMQLLQPATESMIFSSTREQGEAQVSQISKYLEVELSGAEFMHTANFVPNDSERTAFVENFVDRYYSGVLKKGATESAPEYGTGRVHVMLVDNAQKGKISEYVYDVQFDPAESSYIVGSPVVQEYAVNAANYEKYNYIIFPGLGSAVVGEFHFSDFMSAATARDANNTTFTIQAETTRKVQGEDKKYNFSTTATVPLINIANSARVNGYPLGTYYVRNLVTDADGKNPGDVGYTNTYAIQDVSSVRFGILPAETANIAGETAYGNRPLAYPADYTIGGMCFIYSYGSEIDTSN